MDPPQNQCQYYIRKIVRWRWWRINNITPQKVFRMMYMEKFFFDYVINRDKRKKIIDIDMILFTLFYIVENRADNVIHYLFICFLSILFIRIFLLLFI